MRVFRNNKMRSDWIDLMCSSPYVFTSLKQNQKTNTNRAYWSFGNRDKIMLLTVKKLNFAKFWV